MKIEREWKDYEKIIWRLARKFARSLGEEPRDLVQEGFIHFLNVIEYEQKYGLTCTFEAALTVWVKSEFLNAYEKRQAKKRKGILVDIQEVQDILPIEKNHRGRIDAFLSLPKDYQIIVAALYQAPPELAHLLKTRLFKDAIETYFFKYHGWRRSRLKKLWMIVGDIR